MRICIIKSVFVLRVQGAYFQNFKIVKLRPDKVKENERVESCPCVTGNRQNIVHSRIKHRDIDELG